MFNSCTDRFDVSRAHNYTSGFSIGLLVSFLIFSIGGTSSVQAQTYVDGDDGKVSVSSATVDCGGTGTSAETSVSDAVTTGASDIDVCGGTYSGESFTIDSSVDVRPVDGSGTVEITSSQTGSTPFVINASDVTLRDLTIRHTGTSGENVNTLGIQSGDNVDLVNLTITRKKLASTFRTINLGDHQTVRIEDCDLNGGAIGDGDTNGNYDIIDNTISGTGDEAVWIYPEANKISIRNNTVEKTADGNPTNDRKGIAVYGAETSLELEGNNLEVTESAYLLGDDIPILHNGTTSQLETASDLRDVLSRNSISGSSPGTMTFVAKSDGMLRTNADGLHIVRTGITNVPGSGGAGTYNKNALQVAEGGDVIHLSDGASYNESVTLGKSVDFSTPGTASIQTLDIGGNTVGLTGAVSVTSTLTVGSGSTLSGDPIILADGASLTDEGLADGSIKATRTVGGGESVDFGGIGLVIEDKGNATQPGETTVTRTDGDPITKGDGSIDRYYVVTAANESNLDVDLTLAYDDGTNGDDELDENGLSEGNLAIFRSDDGGSTWSQLSVASTSTGNNTVSSANLSSFSRFTVAESGSTLPVELAQLEAVAQNGAAVLKWATASETNNSGFRVQRKTDQGFKTLQFVEGKGTTSQSSSYRVELSELEYGKHTFRLQQVDQDGSTSLSEPVSVRLGMGGRFEVSNVAPNPVAHQSKLDVAVKETQKVQVALYDALGRRVQSLHSGRLSGETTHHISLDTEGLSSGSYFVRVRGEGFETTRRVMVVR